MDLVKEWNRDGWSYRVPDREPSKSDAILAIQVEQGWTDATLLGVLLNYVDSRMSDGLGYVNRRAEG
jgi:hypothetical protein